uniref:7TM GPCR domain containing protein n=1 Tax=Haemonchus contortus TaxID=6289 RepID=A0A7I4Y6X4_HAECO
MEWLIKAGGNPENIHNYNCAGTRRHGNKDYFIGVCFIIYGVLAELMYILVLHVIARKEYRRLSCYKIMLVLGLYDMCAIGVNSLLTGYFWLIGANYCSTPLLMYVAGAIGLGLWCGACMICFVLVINRLLDLWNRQMMQLLFKDNRTYAILLIPFCYSIYFVLFTPPLLFNSDHTAWFFSPFIEKNNDSEFFNYPHTANNLLIVVLTCLLYVQYSRLLLKNSKIDRGLSWAQKSFFLQSSSICMANLVAALIYVYMQFFPTPLYFVLIGHICWQFGHGFPAMVYLLLNRTIQREALLLLRLRKRHNSIVPSRTIQSRTLATSDLA